MKPKSSKSAAIKAALAAHKDEKPQEIAEIVTKSGIKVTAAYVSNIKNSLKLKGAKKAKRGRPAGKKATVQTMGFEIGSGHTGHNEAFMFVQKVGSLSAAKKLLEDLAILAR